MPLTLGTGIPLITGGASFLQGMSSAKASKEHSRRLAQYQQAQNETYRQAQPLYLQALQQYAQSLGIGSSPGVQQTGPNQFRLGPAQDRGQFGMGGQYGSYEDQLRLRAGEEDISRYTQQQANQLRHGLGMRGVAPEIQAAALARNQSAANQQYGQFRRGLAINAGQERERRLQQLMGMLGPGLGAGGQAAAISAQQGALAGQEAQQAFAGAGNILQNYQYMNALGRGGASPYQIGDEEAELLAQLGRSGGGTMLDPATGRYVMGTADTYSLGSGTSGTPIIDPMTGRIIGYR